ncbi:phage major tail protein, TP901-1 family [Bacillus spizizenii]|uniref:phage major tail protein, TP901-1 family n=1 Tax=Bacillus spizizenii TaxID=96241 RepID=UPI002FC73B84
MGIEYRGDEFLYAIKGADGLMRPFNQTDGGTTRSFDSIDLDTKDKSGADYGKETQEISLEGIITEGDDFIEYMDDKLDKKEFVEIYEINTRTKTAKAGDYMISSFEKKYGNGDFATYSLSGTLNGKTRKETLIEIPTGADGQITEETPTTGGTE